MSKPPHNLPTTATTRLQKEESPAAFCATVKATMVEILEPGTEAETCLMAGRGMNGLRGVVVCFNPNNQRYTLELEKGDMMSLKIRNVRAIKPDQDEDEDTVTNTGKNDAEPSPSAAPMPYAKGQEVFYLSASGATPATIVEAHRDELEPYYTIQLADGKEKQTDAKHLTPIREEERHGFSGPPHEGNVGSSLPRSPPAPKAEDYEDGERPGSPGGQGLGVSPVTAAFAAAAAYFYLKSSSNNNNPNPPPARGNYYPRDARALDLGVSVPVLIAAAVFAFLAWEWGTKPGRRPRGDFQLSNISLRLSRCDIWETMGLLGLLLWSLEFPVYHIVSVGILSYFVWKFGTRNGARRFSWDNVKTRLGNLSVWEALMVAHVVQDGLGALNHMARHRRR